MEIQTFYNYKCVECGNELFIRDILKNEFYCVSCGLIHDMDMLDDARDNYYKELLKQIKENEPDVYYLIKQQLLKEKS